MSSKFSKVLIFLLMFTGNIHLQQDYENEIENNYNSLLCYLEIAILRTFR